MFEQNSFCDDDQGWAIYNGELRHGKNSTCKKFKSETPDTDSKFQQGDVVGVLFDSTKGTLAYKRNNKYLGVAF